MADGKMDVLVVADMQNDFISGPLGTPEAQDIVPRVLEKVRGFSGLVLFTRDTHQPDYLDTQEGSLLPVVHCLVGSEGWRIHPDLDALRKQPAIDKPAFGAWRLGEALKTLNQQTPIHSITFVGVCTDICVISNALLVKAALPEANIIVDAACCAGVTKKSHAIALEAMKSCQIHIENEAVS